jgi:hypothetical protein
MFGSIQTTEILQYTYRCQYNEESRHDDAISMLSSYVQLLLIFLNSAYKCIFHTILLNELSEFWDYTPQTSLGSNLMKEDDSLLGYGAV